MRRGAVVTAATIGVWLSACALDKPAETTDNTTQTNARSHVSETSAPPGPTVLAQGVAQTAPAPVSAGDVENSPTSIVTDDVPAETASNVAAEPAESATGSQSAVSRDNDVRDAKEAAEEAARKILDVTLGAANKIKEVGLGAVQSVRETTSRDNDVDTSDATGELAANGDVEVLAD